MEFLFFEHFALSLFLFLLVLFFSFLCFPLNDSHTIGIVEEREEESGVFEWIGMVFEVVVLGVCITFMQEKYAMTNPGNNIQIQNTLYAYDDGVWINDLLCAFYLFFFFNNIVPPSKMLPPFAYTQYSWCAP